MKSLVVVSFIVVMAGCVAPSAQSPARKQPQVLAMPVPPYPAELKKNGVGGDVVVDFNVGSDGRVHNAVIVSTPDVRLGDAVLQATADWRFAPATIDGKPVATHLRVPVDFDPKGAK